MTGFLGPGARLGARHPRTPRRVIRWTQPGRDRRRGRSFGRPGLPGAAGTRSVLPPMRALVDQVQQSCNLGVLAAGRVLVLVQLKGPVNFGFRPSGARRRPSPHSPAPVSPRASARHERGRLETGRVRRPKRSQARSANSCLIAASSRSTLAWATACRCTAVPSRLDAST